MESNFTYNIFSPLYNRIKISNMRAGLSDSFYHYDDGGQGKRRYKKNVKFNVFLLKKKYDFYDKIKYC